MKTPTDEERQAEIKKLQEMKPKIRRTTAFGDDNWEKIDAQIEVLEKQLDEEEVYGEFEDHDDPDRTSDVVSAAREAVEWLEGQQKEPPSADWEPLVQS